MHNVHWMRKLKKNRKVLTQRLDYFMDAAALLSPLVLLPQVYLIYTTHNVSGLSLPTWTLFSGLNILWILYGAARASTPIIIANSFSGVLNLAGMTGIILFHTLT